MFLYYYNCTTIRHPTVYTGDRKRVCFHTQEEKRGNNLLSSSTGYRRLDDQRGSHEDLSCEKKKERNSIRFDTEWIAVGSIKWRCAIRRL